VAACLCATTPALAAEDPAASLYRPGIVNVIKLTLPPASMQALEVDPEGEYQPASFSLAETAGSPASIRAYSAPIEAQVRLKGTGSFRPLGQKSAFKVKFSKKDPFRGLRKLTPNNMVQDPSMLHEAIAYRAFHAMGVPASRTSFAEVWVNGVNYGLHANVEPYDKVSLEKRFGSFQEPPQHLYEGEDYTDVIPHQVANFQVDEGDEEDRSDLNALLAANIQPDGDWSDAVSPHANLQEMVRMWMAEKYVGQFDGYSGWDDFWLPNNFYLYSDPAGRFRMFPSSLDWTFTYDTPFGGRGGSLFDHCVADRSCLGLYKLAGIKALATIPALDLDTMARCIAARLVPWQKREPPEMAPNTPEAVAEAVSATRSYIAGQPNKLASYLGVAAPPPPPLGACPAYGEEEIETLEEPADEPEEEEPNEEEPKEEGGGKVIPPGGKPPQGGTPPGAGGSPLPATPSLLDDAPPPLVVEEEGPLRLTLTDIFGRRLVTHVHAPAAGQLRLSAALGTGSGPRVCGSRTQVKAGITSVSCRLDESARRRLLAGSSLRLTLSAVLRTAAGAVSEFSRTVKLTSGS